LQRSIEHKVTATVAVWKDMLPDGSSRAGLQIFLTNSTAGNSVSAT